MLWKLVGIQTIILPDICFPEKFGASGYSFFYQFYLPKNHSPRQSFPIDYQHSIYYTRIFCDCLFAHTNIYLSLIELLMSTEN